MAILAPMTARSSPAARRVPRPLIQVQRSKADDVVAYLASSGTNSLPKSPAELPQYKDTAPVQR
jgi:hypothetical protein